MKLRFGAVNERSADYGHRRFESPLPEGEG